ncbi:MarR family winged helix-turn-helix transcriptional regulator [Streptosporangium sp. G11]|uniref:MarR family winged helix-turn-helix transcriptional regulator n=1 Tax=Streptosporangium sp. G11 TaxID=3436926 RepID=UPI003EC12125
MNVQDPDQAQARRRLTSKELSVWRSLMDTTTELRRLLTAQLQEVDVSPGDYAVMLALSEAEGRSLRSSELADTIDWQRSRLSHHLGRMGRRGLIRREECLTDNRGAIIAITEEGMASFRRASAPHLRAVKHYFADALSEQQLDELGGVLASVQTHLAALESHSIARPKSS